MARTVSVENGVWLLDSAHSGVALGYASGGKHGALEVTENRPGIVTHYPARYLPPPVFARGGGVPMSMSDYRAWGEKAQSAPSLREYLEIIYTRRRVGDWILFVPYWMILPIAALGWLALLFWRTRRRKKQTTNVELPNAG